MLLGLHHPLATNCRAAQGPMAGLRYGREARPKSPVPAHLQDEASRGARGGGAADGGCSHGCRRLQPQVLEAATISLSGCNRMCWRWQPSALTAPSVASQVLVMKEALQERMHFRYEVHPLTLPHPLTSPCYIPSPCYSPSCYVPLAYDSPPPCCIPSPCSACYTPSPCYIPCYIPSPCHIPLPGGPRA